MKNILKCFGLVALLALGANALAGVTTQDELNDAVASAEAGVTIEISTAGTYKVPNISKNITIKGAVDGVVFDCVGAGGIASVPNGATFENVAFNMGTADYHGFQHAGQIMMKGCTINGKFFTYGDMEFDGCTFNQTASDYCMWCYAGNITYKDCTINCNGKFANVYNEGNGSWKISAEGCTFNSTKVNKAAFNVKETCGAKMLVYDVVVQDCTANENFPASSTDASGTLYVVSPLVQVDDRKLDAEEAHIVVTMKKTEGGTVKEIPAYPIVKEVAPVEVEGEEILGIVRFTNGVKGRSAGAAKEYAVGVPWLGREADGTVRTGETVDKLIIKNGLRAGDELSVWMPDQGATVNGINQGTKNFSNAAGSYAVYRWNGTKWVGVLDADTGLTAPDAETTVVSRGAAVWYKRAAGADNDFLLAGLVSNKCISVVASGTTAKPTLSLMTNPFPNDAVDAARFKRCQNGDQLVLLNESGGNTTYNYKAGWGNYITTTVRGHVSTVWQAATSLVIPAGKSFWYVSRSATVPQIDWKAAKVGSSAE